MSNTKVDPFGDDFEDSAWDDWFSKEINEFGLKFESSEVTHTYLDNKSFEVYFGKKNEGAIGDSITSSFMLKIL